jgi:7-carboxy-7-deazaguanine synthase
MKINEIFYSIQGEGARCGEPSIFVRFAGCDKSCSFCDTDFEAYQEYTCAQLLREIREYAPCKWIVWTGGEPTLQLTQELVDFMNQLGYYQAIETHGGNPVPNGLGFVTVSPKVPADVLVRNFPFGVDELKYVLKSPQPMPETPVTCCYKSISPINDGASINNENLKHCIALVKANPEWRLSAQMHKYWGVR